MTNIFDNVCLGAIFKEIVSSFESSNFQHDLLGCQIKYFIKGMEFAEAKP